LSSHRNAEFPSKQVVGISNATVQRCLLDDNFVFLSILH